MFLRIYLLLFLVSVSLSVKDEKNSLMYRSHDMQKKMGDLLKKLIDCGQIRVTRIEATDQEHKGFYNLYEFTGEHVQKLPLKYVFDMLQSWNCYVQNQAKPLEISRFKFHFGDGGEAKMVGLQVSELDKPNGANAIIISDESNRQLAYCEIYEVFETSGLEPAEIARYMLEVLNRPMNDQPVWPSTWDDNLRSKMLNFAVLIQTAEAAQPTDEVFFAFVEASVRVHALVKEGNFEKCMTDFSEQLAQNSYDVSGFSNEYETFRDYLKLVTSIVNEKKIARRRQLLRNFSDILPKHTTEFYNNLNNAKKVSDDALRKFLVDHGFDLDDHPHDCLIKLKTAIDNFDKDNSRTAEIKNFLPSITIGKFMALTENLEERMGNLEKYLEEIVSLKNLGFQPNGRIPGIGYLARALLVEIVSGFIRSWKEFDRIFRVSVQGGLRQARENRILFDVSARPEERFVSHSAFEADYSEIMQNELQLFLGETWFKVECQEPSRRKKHAINQILDIQQDDEDEDSFQLKIHEARAIYATKTAIISEKPGIGLGPMSHVYGEVFITGLIVREKLMTSIKCVALLVVILVISQFNWLDIACLKFSD